MPQSQQVAQSMSKSENIIRLNRHEQQRLAQALADNTAHELSDFVKNVVQEYKERVARS